MREFFRFSICIFHKFRMQIHDASAWLKTRYPNVHLGFVGLCLLILPNVAQIVILSQLKLLSLALIFLGCSARVLAMIPEPFFFSWIWLGPLLAIMGTGICMMLFAIVRIILQMRPKHGYLPLTKPCQSIQKKSPETFLTRGHEP